jgi:hypothetical protein
MRYTLFAKYYDGRPLRCWPVAAFLATLWSAAAGAYDFAPPAPGLSPDAINTFQLYVGDQETYDSNLFRLPPGTAGVPGAAIANASQSDFVSSPAAGGEGRWDLAQQEFDIKLQASDNRFARNTALNYVGADGAGTWNWHGGPYLSGQVGVSYDRTLAGFGQTRFSGYDVVGSLDEYGTARYQLGPHWAVYGELSGAVSDHSAEIEKFNDFHNKSGKAGVQYVTNGMDTYGFEYQYVDLTFDSGAPDSVTGFDYKEDSGRFLLHYALSDKTIIDGYGGYLRRQYPGLVIGAYSGEIGRATVLYNWTEKTQFIVAGWHELHAYIDAESQYFVAQGASFSPVWNASEKISFVLLASHESQNYIGSNSIEVSSPRHDKIDVEQATIRYQPRDAWTISLFLRHEKRDSNQYVFSYDDTLLSGSVTFRFL